MVLQSHEIYASPFDHSRQLLAELPRARAGYILARIALAQYDGGSRGGDYAKTADEALRTLHATHLSGELSPPLDSKLAGLLEAEINYMNEHNITNGRAIAGVVLLAWAIDGSERIQ